MSVDSVFVRVPATSANLGPGFDALGLSFAYYDELRATRSEGPTRVTVTGEGEGQVPSDESHLVVKAFLAALAYRNVAPFAIELQCTNRIPHGRGMGSSASAVVAGIALAQGFLSQKEQLSRAEMLQLATDFEGHPDNAAPAIYGGATVAWMSPSGQGGSDVATARSLPMMDIPLTVCVPSFEVPTSSARGLLPATVPHKDAAQNAGRAALLVFALGHSPQDLLAATTDTLHQDYRQSAMPSSHALMSALRSMGIAAVISGAGPTVLAMNVKSAEVLARGEAAGIDLEAWRIFDVDADTQGVSWQALD